MQLLSPMAILRPRPGPSETLVQQQCRESHPVVIRTQAWNLQIPRFVTLFTGGPFWAEELPVLGCEKADAQMVLISGSKPPKAAISSYCMASLVCIRQFPSTWLNRLSVISSPSSLATNSAASLTKSKAESTPTMDSPSTTTRWCTCSCSIF
jgi:hypothetical protein